MSNQQPPITDTRAHDPLRRREAGGQLRGFRPEYAAKKHEALVELLGAVRSAGSLVPALLERPELAAVDERIVEYPVALEELMALNRAGSPTVLDVGCVLNNRAISNHVSDLCESIWLLNSSRETVVYTRNVAYVLSDIRSPKLPPSVQFDLVTCLSTVEHIGMDNTRYGGLPAEFQGEDPSPERFAIAGVRSLAPFVRPGGRLLISVPYGPFEYVYVYGQPDRPIYYTFDRPRAEALISSLDGFDVSPAVYKVVPGRGWVSTTLDDDQRILRHADQCAAAGAVLFIRAQRRQVRMESGQ